MFPTILKSVSSIMSYSYLIIEFLIKSISFWIKSSQFNSIKFVRFGAKFDLEIGLRCVRNRRLYIKQLMKTKQKLHSTTRKISRSCHYFKQRLNWTSSLCGTLESVIMFLFGALPWGHKASRNLSLWVRPTTFVLLSTPCFCVN